MMPDDQHPNSIVAYEAKQNRIRETAQECAAYVMLNHGILEGVVANSRNGCIGFGSQLIAEAGALVVVVIDSAIEIGRREWMIFDIHSRSPPVRRKNSA